MLTYIAVCWNKRVPCFCMKTVQVLSVSCKMCSKTKTRGSKMHLKISDLFSSMYYLVTGLINKDVDVRGSVHHSIIHKENPTRSNSASKFYFIFIWSSTCFGRHTAHHKKPKTAIAAPGFAYVGGCWTWTAPSNYTSNNPPRMQNQRLLVQF